MDRNWGQWLTSIKFINDIKKICQNSVWLFTIFMVYNPLGILVERSVLDLVRQRQQRTSFLNSPPSTYIPWCSDTVVMRLLTLNLRRCDDIGDEWEALAFFISRAYAYKIVLVLHQVLRTVPRRHGIEHCCTSPWRPVHLTDLDDVVYNRCSSVVLWGWPLHFQGVWSSVDDVERSAWWRRWFWKNVVVFNTRSS